MSYADRFHLADNYVQHLDLVLDTIDDGFIASRYTGFLAVSAVTVYELAIKDIFVSFSEKKHRVFGEFSRSHFARINGRISSREIVREHLPRFGEKYVKRFRKNRDTVENRILRLERISVLSSYNNIVIWRNQFAHEGVIPNTVTFSEMKTAYFTGKHIIHCLAATMNR